MIDCSHDIGDTGVEPYPSTLTIKQVFFSAKHWQSLDGAVTGKGSPHSDGRLAGELFGNAYYREGNLKLLGMRPQAGFGDNAQPLQWQLFDLARDRGETTDLAAAQPGTVERLKAVAQGMVF